MANFVKALLKNGIAEGVASDSHDTSANARSEIVCPIDCASLQPPSHCNLWFMLETKNCPKCQILFFFKFSNVNKKLAILMTV